ncbi:hypothetical protein SUGI_0042620 [Cryptomeria japonica]|nr:hypothetical protein SUGI_0042620 [Cryptomeria japonica]
MADVGNVVPAAVRAAAPEIIKLVTMSLGLCYFIYLIFTDIWAALWGKPRTQWIRGMANRGSAEASSDIVALVVSLFTAIVSELYYVRKAGNILSRVDYDYAYEFLTNYNNKPTVKLWFIVSSVIFLTTIICLILFSVSAIIAGKTVRCTLK